MQKAMRACAEIDLDALQHNVESIRRAVGNDTKIMGVIKTNAYGHGAAVIAKELIGLGVSEFAVATLEEGIELRKSGIIQPILVLGNIPKDQYKDMVHYRIMPTVFTYDMAKDIDAAAAAVHAVAQIHIKIDTGMSRIGFKPNDETVQNIVMMSSLLKNIKIQGIFTHFSCADCAEDTMTKKQFDSFMWVIGQLEEKGIRIPERHCANSAAIMRYPEMKLDMVRAGIILYGLYPSDEISKDLMHLEPVMSLKSMVSCIKDVDAGTPVGYGATYVCPKKTRIATVSIGYGDGYPRALSGHGRVIIDNQYFPIIGRICMDQLMVDITDAQTAIKRGDEVVLVGQQGSCSISVEEASSYNNSFNYEFVCDINRRVPRVYMRGGKAVACVNYLY